MHKRIQLTRVFLMQKTRKTMQNNGIGFSLEQKRSGEMRVVRLRLHGAGRALRGAERLLGSVDRRAGFLPCAEAAAHMDHGL